MIFFCLLAMTKEDMICPCPWPTKQKTQISVLRRLLPAVAIARQQGREHFEDVSGAPFGPPFGPLGHGSFGPTSPCPTTCWLWSLHPGAKGRLVTSCLRCPGRRLPKRALRDPAAVAHRFGCRIHCGELRPKSRLPMF